MKQRYWILSLLLPLLLPSCKLYDALFTTYDPQPTPDTIVLSIDPQRTEVQYLTTDSTYRITRYWMDTYGNRLYKCLEEFYKKGRLVGPRYEWNEQGILTHKSFWDEGVKIDTAMEWHNNGALKEITVFTAIGNPQMQYRAFDNNRKQTDTVYFDSLGRRNDQIKFYNAEGRHIETYYYRNDTLLNVDIYKDAYTILDRKAQQLADKKMKEQKSRDSVDIVKRTNPAAFDYDPERVLRIVDDPTW